MWGGGGRGVWVLPTGQSFLLVFACWLLHKGCHHLLYPAIPREFFQVVSLYAMYSTSLAHHNKSNSQGKGWGGLIIGARGFIIFVPLQVNVPISSGVYKWGGLTVYKCQITVWRFDKIVMVNYLPPASKHIACQWQHVLHHHHFFSKLSQPWHQACLWICDK